MYQKRDYYILKKPSWNLWSIILAALKIPFSLPRWIISFFLSRNVTNITLNPNQIKIQKPVHLIFVSNEKEDEALAIINILPQESNKILKDYLLKFSSTIIHIPFISKILKRQLHYDNPEDKAHIDKVIAEIDLLLQGNSTHDKCVGKKFSMRDLHIKGLAGLDSKLHAYFYERLYTLYGTEIVDQPRKIQLDFFTLQTKDSAVLDSVAVSRKREQEKPISERKFIIACMARDQNYINWIKDFNHSAKKIGCTIIGFNYRGVDYSKGMVWTQDNMVDDAIAQFQRLIDLGAKPENIGFEGMSLGGAIATLAAAKLHGEGYRVKLYNERSFRSLIRLITGYIIPESNSNPWNPINWLRFATAGLVYIILGPILWLVGWGLDAERAWNKIPQVDKEYSVARDHSDTDSKDDQNDGVIHDSWASIASLVDEQQENLREKAQGENLTVMEQIILADPAEHHHFKISKEGESLNKLPHHVPRRYLENQNGHLHNHMIQSFIRKFGYSSLSPRSRKIKSTVDHPAATVRRPLLIAASGGTGHISAIMGIVDELKKDKTMELHLTQHQAERYQDKAFSFLGITLRACIYIMSIRVVGPVFGYIARFAGMPYLPYWNAFQEEIKRLERAETVINEGYEEGRKRPYLDMMLDLFPIGYESIALVNTLHRMDRARDINLLVTHKSSSEKLIYQKAYITFLTELIHAAETGEAYSEVITTQPVALNALCDAVNDYNQFYLPKKNSKLQSPLPHVAIHQFLTDLPSLECGHFLDILSELTIQQKQQIHLYAVNISPAIIKSYLDKGQHFQGIHSLSPKSNPMIRAAFKEKSLEKYLDKNKECTVTIKSYQQGASGEWTLQKEKETVNIPAKGKVATIMLGSLASDATVAYVKELLESDLFYDKIFVFGGINKSIYQPIEDIINTYPEHQRQAIRARIVRLGNQDDVEIAPIMTRSDMVIIRGGGSCVMEQMALPCDLQKAYLFHHKDSEKEGEELSCGLKWEDGNIDVLTAYLSQRKIFAKKTSPQLAKEAIKEANGLLRTSLYTNPALSPSSSAAKNEPENSASHRGSKFFQHYPSDRYEYTNSAFSTDGEVSDLRSVPAISLSTDLLV